MSNLAKDKIIAKHGSFFEIVNSVRDKEHLEIIKQRVAKSYPKFAFIEEMYVRKVFSEEYREKLRQAKLGKKRSEEAKAKISASRKGKGNFEGKRHKEVSKRMTADSMKGNKNVRGRVWAYDPNNDKEIRAESRSDIPQGYRLGRDPDSVNDVLGSSNF